MLPLLFALPLLGAAGGALLGKKRPLENAAIGAGLGLGGAFAAPLLGLGAAGAVGTAGTGAAAAGTPAALAAGTTGVGATGIPWLAGLGAGVTPAAPMAAAPAMFPLMPGATAAAAAQPGIMQMLTTGLGVAKNLGNLANMGQSQSQAMPQMQRGRVSPVPQMNPSGNQQDQIMQMLLKMAQMRGGRRYA